MSDENRSKCLQEFTRNCYEVLTTEKSMVDSWQLLETASKKEFDTEYQQRVVQIFDDMVQVGKKQQIAINQFYLPEKTKKIREEEVKTYNVAKNIMEVEIKDVFDYEEKELTKEPTADQIKNICAFIEKSSEEIYGFLLRNLEIGEDKQNAKTFTTAEKDKDEDKSKRKMLREVCKYVDGKNEDTITDITMTPFQRMPRYVLLLREMIENYSEYIGEKIKLEGNGKFIKTIKKNTRTNF